jgi:hypothetical protein
MPVLLKLFLFMIAVLAVMSLVMYVFGVYDIK